MFGSQSPIDHHSTMEERNTLINDSQLTTDPLLSIGCSNETVDRINERISTLDQTAQAINYQSDNANRSTSQKLKDKATGNNPRTQGELIYISN